MQKYEKECLYKNKKYRQEAIGQQIFEHQQITIAIHFIKYFMYFTQTFYLLISKFNPTFIPPINH